MPSPKNGTAGSAVPPAAPKRAEEADKAEPGEVEKVKAEQEQNQNGKYGSAQTKAHKRPQTEEEKAKKKHWIEIELVDTHNKPVPGEPYRITLPDGATVAEGTLDEEGVARVDGLDPGMCKVTFPNLEKEAWKPK